MPDKGFEEVVIDRIMQTAPAMSEAAAGMMGLPPGGKKYSTQEQLEEWSWSPIASPQERVQAMIQLYDLGKTKEEITDAIYPKRRRLIETSRVTAGEQIGFAKDMNRLMERQAADLGMQLPPPPESMPSAPGEMAALPEPQPLTPAVPSVDGLIGSPQPTPQPSILDQPFSQIGG